MWWERLKCEQQTLNLGQLIGNFAVQILRSGAKSRQAKAKRRREQEEAS
jgi:hypothetical protein